MTMPKLPHHPFPRLCLAGALLMAGAALAGCETTGGATPAAAAAPAPEPMSHTQAAEYCWMATEHGHGDLPLDKRADIVDRCIKEKLAGEAAHLRGRNQADTKKP